MRGIPQLLRTRISGAAGTTLPELGALLGRGSFGKVYKGQRQPSGFMHVNTQCSCIQEVCFAFVCSISANLLLDVHLRC